MKQVMFVASICVTLLQTVLSIGKQVEGRKN
jgi:hypothetical protein